MTMQRLFAFFFLLVTALWCVAAQEGSESGVQLVAGAPASSAVCAGGYFSLALSRDDGSVHAWGLLPPNATRSPSRVPGLSERVTAIACGGYHAAALGASGRVFTWGSSRDGALGYSSSSSSLEGGDGAADDDEDTFVPRAVSEGGLAGKRVVDVCAGFGHTAALTDAGEVFLWGKQTAAAAASADADASEFKVPRMLLADKESGAPLLAERIACGGRHVALVPKGDRSRVLMLGSSAFGALGAGDAADAAGHVLTPREVLLPHERCAEVTGVSCGGDHTFVQCSGGVAFGFGWNEHGQLGLGDTENRHVPAELPLDDDPRELATLIAGAYSSSLALWTTGEISGCGFSEYSVADGSTYAPGFAPVAQTLLANVRLPPNLGAAVQQASIGFKHAVLLLSDGRVAALGDNSFSQLGETQD